MKRIVKGDKLPGTLWELLTVALKDLKSIKQDNRFGVHMNAWISYDSISQRTPRCTVCLAGSALVREWNLDVEEALALSRQGQFLEDWDIPVKTVKKLNAIDSLRQGEIEEAFHYLYPRSKAWPSLNKVDGDPAFAFRLPEKINIFPYRENPKKWELQMHKLIKLLKKAKV
jgi:hypothetical protein